MSKLNLSAGAIAVLLLASSAFAQRTTPPAQPAQNPGPTAGAQALPTIKMAVIDTDAFLDPKNGITQFNSLLTKLNGEFQTPKNEIQQMQTRAQTLTEDISKLQAASQKTPIDQKSIQSKTEQLDQLKKDIQRRGEDAQTAYNKRRQELFTPLQNQIGKALEAFAKAKGINVIIDASQVPLLYVAENTDITRAFIADFNSKSPATASSTPPK
jgi:outer membrane protein